MECENREFDKKYEYCVFISETVVQVTYMHESYFLALAAFPVGVTEHVNIKFLLNLLCIFLYLKVNFIYYYYHYYRVRVCNVPAPLDRHD